MLFRSDHAGQASIRGHLAHVLRDQHRAFAAARQRGQQTAAEEAIALYRHLADTAPALHSPHLAAALHTLSRHLGMHSKHPSLREAADLYRRLNETDPTTYRPRLAATLHTLATALDGLGRTSQAASSRAEANSLLHDYEPAL